MKDLLAELARPFPPKYVHTNPSGGGSYVKHHVVNQRLIQVFGRPPGFTLVEIVRGDVPAIAPNPQGKSQRAKEGAPALTNVVVGVVARMTVGSFEPVEEAGDCEEPHNWKTDGQRLKDAFSDAFKRCAMRLGCGIHLWSGDEYFLYDKLAERSEVPGAGTSVPHTEAVVPKAVSETSDPTVSPPERSESGAGFTGSDTQTADADGTSTAPDPEDAFWGNQEAKI